MRHGLQLVFNFEIGAQPGGLDGARRKAGDAGELDHLLVAGPGQHPLVFGMCVAFQRDRERRSKLRSCRAQALEPGDVLQAADAASGYERHLAFYAGRSQKGS